MFNLIVNIVSTVIMIGVIFYTSIAIIGGVVILFESIGNQFKSNKCNCDCRKDK